MQGSHIAQQKKLDLYLLVKRRNQRRPRNGEMRRLVRGLANAAMILNAPLRPIWGSLPAAIRIRQNALKLLGRGMPPGRMESTVDDPGVLGLGVGRTPQHDCLAGLKATRCRKETMLAPRAQKVEPAGR